MPMSKKRKYQPIWDRLKNKDECAIKVANIVLMERVIKAVIKEKDMDKGFQLLNPLEKFRLNIQRDKETCKVTFKLVATIGIDWKVVP
jgi:hypothetical protein